VDCGSTKFALGAEIYTPTGLFIMFVSLVVTRTVSVEQCNNAMNMQLVLILSAKRLCCLLEVLHSFLPVHVCVRCFAFIVRVNQHTDVNE